MKVDDLNILLKCAADTYCQRTCPKRCNYMDEECQECEKRAVFMEDTIGAHKYEVSTAKCSIRETFVRQVSRFYISEKRKYKFFNRAVNYVFKDHVVHDHGNLTNGMDNFILQD